VLDVARHYIAVNTPAYIVLLVFGVILGGMGLYSNDSNRKRWFMRHLGTIFGLLAVSCGVGAVYTQSRADAASRAASEVEQALIARSDRIQYELCLDVTSRWDNSRTASTAAVSAVAAEKADRVSEAASDLIEAIEASAEYLEGERRGRRGGRGQGRGCQGEAEVRPREREVGQGERQERASRCWPCGAEDRHAGDSTTGDALTDPC
jgi:hypothetical protein